MITADDLLHRPSTDPTSIYRYRDGLYAADLLAAAVCHLDFFSWLLDHPSDSITISRSLGLVERPLDVMLTLFNAMGLVKRDGETFEVTSLAKEHLGRSSPWSIAPYFASVKDRQVCLDMVEVLRTGKPARWASLHSEKEWIKAMENDAFASQFTAAMDCRGVFLAPAMAERLDCAPYRHLLDVAGGSGIYSCAMVARHPHLRATILERPPVDALARRSVAERGFTKQVSVATGRSAPVPGAAMPERSFTNQVTVTTGDMFADPFPEGCDIHLFSNVLHDWDTPRVGQLLAKSCSSLKPGGMIVIHDAHIDADKTGPLPVAAYSVLLMTLTEGKCYSQSEMAHYLSLAGFSDVHYFPTAADRSVVTAKKKDGL